MVIIDASQLIAELSVVAQFGVKSVWRNKFRPTTPFFVGPNLFGLSQTEPLPNYRHQRGCHVANYRRNSAIVSARCRTATPGPSASVDPSSFSELQRVILLPEATQCVTLRLLYVSWLSFISVFRMLPDLAQCADRDLFPEYKTTYSLDSNQ